MITRIGPAAAIIIFILLVVYIIFGSDENQTHSWSLWSGHTITETVIIDGNKYIKFTDDKGRTTLTAVPK